MNYLVIFVILNAFCIVTAVLPVVVWHALGSNCCDQGTTQFINQLKANLPAGTKFFSIRVGSTPSEDEKRSYFDDANDQVDQVCRMLKGNKDLSNGFNAVGLSQGGLLFRALVEKCNGLKVNNLITFGSPLQGVAAYPGCGAPSSYASQAMRARSRTFQQAIRQINLNLIPCPILNTLVGGAVYSKSAQSRIMPAQYFKDPKKINEYLKNNKFLADINNEKGSKNQTYKKNLTLLKNFVVVSFAEEEIVFPQESTNLGYYENGQLRPLRQLTMYKEDWIGLKTLDQRRSLIQIRVPGEHLDINQSVINKILPYLLN